MNLINKMANAVALGGGLLAVAGLLAVCSWSQHAFAMGPGGGGNGYTTVCDELSSLDADGKKSNSDVDDAISIAGKLKSRNANPLVYEINSTVSIATGFTGGLAELPLVINPDPDNLSFDGFLVPVNADCSRTSDPIMASFNGGTDQRSIDPAVDGNVLNQDVLEDLYKGISAVAGFPTSAWDSDANLLYTAVCNEVKDALGSPAGVLTLAGAGDVGIVAGSQGQTLQRCLKHSSLVTYVGGPEGGCTTEEVTAATTDVDANILDIPSMSMGATSAGSGQFVVTLTNPDDCTVTITMDLSDCSAPDVDDPCS